MNTCAPCRPVSPKNVAANDVSLVLKPIRWYSITCVSRKVRPSRNVSTIPAQRPGAVALLDRRVAQCIVKLERDEDQRVDARDERRTLVAVGRPDPVDAVVDDAVEEVDGEERAEEHDLRRDEEEHPERSSGETREL